MLSIPYNILCNFENGQSKHTKRSKYKTAHLNYVHAAHNHTSLFRCTSSGMNVIGSRFELLALTAHLQEGTGAHFFRIGAKTASINRKIKFI